MAEVEVTRDGAVQTITLNRPEVFNAFNRALHAALRDALKEARDPGVRAVVVTGAGRGFCAGQDLTEFGEAPDVGDSLRATYHPNVLAIRALEKPVIAAVNGACAGAGLSLACACDARGGDDEAPVRPCGQRDARGAARARGAAAGRRGSDRRLPRGRRRLRREAPGELQRELSSASTSPSSGKRCSCSFENTIVPS